MRNRIAESPRLYARIAGFLYLIVIVGGIFAEIVVRGQLVVRGDAAATAHNIMTHQMLFRLGFAVELFYCMCNLPMAVIFYNLFKVVDKNVTLLMLFLDLVVNTIESVSILAHYAPLLLLGGGHHLGAFTAEQLQALSYLSLEFFEHGFAVALAFFGIDCLALSYLIYRSNFLPRILALPLAIEAVGYLVNSFALFLAPDLQRVIFPYFVVTAIAEVALCLWLLLMGVNEQRWKEQASAAEDPR